MKLSEFQNLFSQLLLSPGSPIIANQFPLKQKDEEAKERISIYRNNVFSSLIEALGDLYPTVKQLVGDETFANIARKYFSKNPPAEAAMINLAQDFPAYLVQQSIHSTLPYIQDIALLDLFYHQSYHAEEAEPLSPEDFMAVDPEELAEKRLKLHPACTFMASRYAIFDIWQLHYADNAPEKVDMDKPQNIVVTRPQTQVELLKVEKPILNFLKMLKKNCTLSMAMDRTMNEETSATFLIQFLIENKLVVALR